METAVVKHHFTKKKKKERNRLISFIDTHKLSVYAKACDLISVT